MNRSIRVWPLAIALLSSAWIGAAAAATGDVFDFKHANKLMADGRAIAQIANTRVFKEFEGEEQSPYNLGLAAVSGGDTVRSVRVLVERKDSDSPLFALAAGGAGVEVMVSSSTMKVNFKATVSSQTAETTQSKLLNRSIPADVKYLMFSLYFVPKASGGTTDETEGETTDESPWADTVFLAANEADVQGAHVLVGREIANPVRASLSSDGLDDLIKEEIKLTSAENDNRTVVFVEQRSLVFAGAAGSHHRSKRCFEDFLQGLTTFSAWWWERLLGAPSICANRAGEVLPDGQIDVVETHTLPANIDLSLYDSGELDAGDTQDFDAAMGALFCGDGADDNGDAACTLADREAIASIGELSPDAIQSLINEINTHNFNSLQGAAAMLEITSTGNAELDRWLVDDTERAGNALSAALNINQVSDSREEPQKASNLKKRKKKVVKAACVESKISDDLGWECVKKAKGKVKRSEGAIALPPLLQTGGRYYLSSRTADSNDFQSLVASFLRRSPEMPAGIHINQFEKLTAAIAYDGAIAGDNLGIVYMNNPTLGDGLRFSYGLNHIWAEGGGGVNGHRDDWRALSVDSGSLLTRVVMAALTDVGARYRQKRTSDGKVERTYERFKFVDGGRVTVFRNIRIVLRQNGMIVTAFPLKGAKREENKLLTM